MKQKQNKNKKEKKEGDDDDDDDHNNYDDVDEYDGDDYNDNNVDDYGSDDNGDDSDDGKHFLEYGRGVTCNKVFIPWCGVEEDYVNYMYQYLDCDLHVRMYCVVLGTRNILEAFLRNGSVLI